MSLRITSRRFCASAFAAAVGGIGLYVYDTRHNVQGLESFVGTSAGHSKKLPAMPKQFPSTRSRNGQIADLKRSVSGDIYDLLVIGGGATGSGIALDAATRGLKVALVEREDFSSGTSSKSTKLVHGGVRYLEKAVWNLDYDQYNLVREALRERQNFLHVAPHLSSWLPVMLPLQKWWQAPYFWAGTKFYDLLAGSAANPSSYFLTKRKALELFPMLKKESIAGALVYYDGQHDDARTNISLAMTAALYGATTVNYLEVTQLEKDCNGKLSGAHVRDLMSAKDSKTENDEFVIRAKGIINATGPFADAIEQMDQPKKRDIIAPSLGTHIVLPGYVTPSSMGLLNPATSDGRVLFLLPWQGNTLAGTTDAPCGITRNPVAKEDDIGFILNEIRDYLNPDINLRREDVLAAWSGIRPLVRDPNSTNTESLVRSHLVTVSDSGLITCAGGKWTTYRQMAQDAVDKAVEVFNLKPRTFRQVNISGLPGFDESPLLDGSCQTRRIRLVGAHGYSDALFVQLMQHFGLQVDVAKHLAESYGDRAWEVASLMDPVTIASRDQRLSPNYPFVEAEVRYAVRREYAQTATDLVARRTRLAFLDAQAALDALPTIIDVMGDELQWPPDRRDFEWSETMRYLESMGLPKSKLGMSREEVLNGIRETGLEPTATAFPPTDDASVENDEPRRPNVLDAPIGVSGSFA